MSERISSTAEREHGRIYAWVVSMACLARGIEIIIRARPKTPLRALCAVTFDALYRLRRAERLPFDRIRTLLVLLEIGACINRFFDRKGFDRQVYRRLRRQASRKDIAPITRNYIKRLRAIEQDRPLPGGDAERFHAVKAYRESVVRLSLALVTAAVFDLKTLDQGMQAMRGEDDFEIIFRIVMQCQVIDDALDYRKDKAAELPSFLTATTSRQASEGLTRHTVADYRDVNDLSRSKATLPFLIALWLVSACTSSVLIWTSQGANDTTARRQ